MMRYLEHLLNKYFFKLLHYKIVIEHFHGKEDVTSRGNPYMN